MKIAFFWTWDFSKNILESLFTHYRQEVEIVWVISQPDKPFWRTQILKPTPVKEFSLQVSLPILQPERLKENIEIVSWLENLEVDFIVVVAYGKIIPQTILDIPKYGCINIHGSLLPHYRGASPIQASLKNGDTTTGLTIMYMSAGMDEWDILSTQEIQVDIRDTTLDIFEKFTQIWPKLLVDTLQKVLAKDLIWVPQDHTQATFCKKIEKEDGKIDFERESVDQIYNKFRAYTPWPGVSTLYHGKKFDITDCFFEKEDILFDDAFHLWDVIEYEDYGKKSIGILCHGGILILYKVKLEWKKEMNIVDFINGNKDFLEYNFL